MSFEESLKKHNDFKVLYKDESKFMKLLGTILFFNKAFMTRFTTTIGKFMYFPNREYLTGNKWLAQEIMAHEYVHVVDYKRKGWRFVLGYLFPQILALLALLAIPAAFLIGPFALLFLVFLLCAAPIPAYWRKEFEVRGYTMSLFVIAEQMRATGQTEERIREELKKTAKALEKNFTGPSYYFMWPFGVMAQIEPKIDQIISGVISDTDEVFVHVSDALKEDS